MAFEEAVLMRSNELVFEEVMVNFIKNSLIH